MYVLLWLNTMAAVQMFFIELIFVFFMALLIRKMGIILSASKLHCHFTLSKPTLIYPFIDKNILGKHLSQAICFKYGFRLLHATKFQIFSTKLKRTVKVVKVFPRVLRKSCSDVFYRKAPMQESLFK